jgi:hypothetical protein
MRDYYATQLVPAGWIRPQQACRRRQYRGHDPAKRSRRASRSHRTSRSSQRHPDPQQVQPGPTRRQLQAPRRLAPIRG